MTTSGPTSDAGRRRGFVSQPPPPNTPAHHKEQHAGQQAEEDANGSQEEGRAVSDAEPEGRAAGEAAAVGPLLQSVQDLDPQQVQEQDQQQGRTCRDKMENERSHHSDTAGGSAEQLSLGLDPAESSAR